MKTIDMGWGHPSFMKEYWSGSSTGTFIGFDHGINYQLDSGDSSLLYAIKELHDSEGNAVTGGKHIVIGNGATQIIRAVISVLGSDVVYAQTPYYSRFPETAKKEGKVFNSGVFLQPEGKRVLEIVTTPNNPDGLKKTPAISSNDKMFDLCYNWSQYGNTFKADFPIMVFSLSKATGHAGSRIGWGFFNSKDIADEVQKFIDIDTCGVSADSQTKALSVILDQLKKPKTGRCFHFGRYELKYRWAKLKQVAGNYIDAFKIENRLGMFAVICVYDNPSGFDYFLNFGVQGIRGSAFGMPDSYVRLNIGCETADFDEFIKRLETKTTT